MALTYFGAATSLQRGVETGEPGIGVRSHTVRYHPEVNEFHQNNLGESDGKVVSTLASREITIDGEVTGATTGRMIDTFVAAITTIANDVTSFGSATGGIYLQEATESQSRAEWRSVNLRYESHPLLA